MPIRQRAFPRVELQRPPFLRRLLGRPYPENGYRELQNLLHERPPAEISPELLTATLDSHGVESVDRARFRSMYHSALAVAAEDSELTDDECRELADLRVLLGLTDTDVEDVHREVVTERLGRTARDRVFSEEEKRELEHLREKLKIEPCEIERIRRAVLTPLVASTFEEAFRDRRYSPEEEAEIERFAQNFDVDLSLSDETRQHLRRFRWLWNVEHGTLTPVPVDINLQRNEQCHYVTDATSVTTKSVTRRVNYHGPTARIRIMRGVYYRLGSIAVQPVKVEHEVLEDGRLFITSKRVIFMGERKNQTFRLTSLLGFTPYTDGLELQKSRGRNPIFRVKDPEAACAVLSRVLAEA